MAPTPINYDGDDDEDEYKPPRERLNREPPKIKRTRTKVSTEIRKSSILSKRVVQFQTKKAIEAICESLEIDCFGRRMKFFDLKYETRMKKFRGMRDALKVYHFQL